MNHAAFADDRTSAVIISSGESDEKRIQSFSKNEREFLLEAKSYVADIEKTLDKLIRLVTNKYNPSGYIPIKAEGILDVLFNNNVRDFLENFVKVIATTKVCINHGIYGASNASRRIQYMLLNGSIFVNSQPKIEQSRYNKIPRGEVFPNIF